MLLGVTGAAGYLLLLGVIDALACCDLLSWSPPFGASLVMIFFARAGSQPTMWSVIGGHTIGAVCATAMAVLFAMTPVVLRSAIAVPTAVLAMLVTDSFHPPALITVLMIGLAPARSFGLAILPVLVNGTALLLTRGLLDLGIKRFSEK